MKIITFDDINYLQITPQMCYKWATDMIMNKKETILPPKISLHPTEGVFCNFMPCIIPSTIYENVGGVKIVNRYPDRVPSLDSKLLLMNMQTGEFLALMDANWITAMRTGAVAVHSIKLLAKTGFSRVAIMGLGNTARATLTVLANLFPDRKFKIKLLAYKGQENLFIDRFKENLNLEFSVVDSTIDLVKNSDVVISCVTYMPDDCCPDRYFEDGVLVVPVHTRGFTNCDLFFDKVYADDYGHVCNFKNFNKFRSFAEVSDVVNHRAVGRESDSEKILVYNIGLAIHDINYAIYIYEMLKNNESITEIDMKTPKDKFWI